MSEQPTKSQKAILEYLQTKPEIETVSTTNFGAICELAFNVTKLFVEQQNKIDVDGSVFVSVDNVAYDILESLIGICLTANIDVDAIATGSVSVSHSN